MQPGISVIIPPALVPTLYGLRDPLEEGAWILVWWPNAGWFGPQQGAVLIYQCS